MYRVYQLPWWATATFTSNVSTTVASDNCGYPPLARNSWTLNWTKMTVLWGGGGGSQQQQRKRSVTNLNLVERQYILLLLAGGGPGPVLTVPAGTPAAAAPAGPSAAVLPPLLVALLLATALTVAAVRARVSPGAHGGWGGPVARVSPLRRATATALPVPALLLIYNHNQPLTVCKRPGIQMNFKHMSGLVKFEMIP